MSESKISAAEIVAAIRRSYRPNEVAILEEVCDAAGFSWTRRIDVLTIGLWGSTRHQVEAYEVKVSRSDWLRETKDFAKAEAFAAMVDRFWVAAAPGVVEVSELPEKWGLREIRGDKLRTVRGAQAMVEGGRKTLPIGFVAAIIKRATDAVHNDAARLAAEMDAERRAKYQRDLAAAVERRTRQATELEQARDVILALAGITEGELFALPAAEIGRAIRIIRDAGVLETWRSIRGAADAAAVASERMRAAVAQIDALSPETTAALADVRKRA